MNERVQTNTRGRAKFNEQTGLPRTPFQGATSNQEWLRMALKGKCSPFRAEQIITEIGNAPEQYDFILKSAEGENQTGQGIAVAQRRDDRVIEIYCHKWTGKSVEAVVLEFQQ